MNVTLNPELQALVRRQLQTGNYETPDQVMEEALQLLDQRDRERRLDAALEVGDDQYRQGNVIPWSADLREQIKRDAEEMARQGKQPNPDVCPD